MNTPFSNRQRFDSIGDEVASLVELACVATAAYLVVSTEKRPVGDILLFVFAVLLCALVYQLLVYLIIPPDYYQKQAMHQQQQELQQD